MWREERVRESGRAPGFPALSPFGLVYPSRSSVVGQCWCDCKPGCWGLTLGRHSMGYRWDVWRLLSLTGVTSGGEGRQLCIPCPEHGWHGYPAGPAFLRGMSRGKKGLGGGRGWELEEEAEGTREGVRVWRPQPPASPTHFCLSFVPCTSLVGLELACVLGGELGMGREGEFCLPASS